MNKRAMRMKRATRTRAIAKKLRKTRASVFRSSNHIYVQAIDHMGKVLACASSIDKALRSDLKNGGNIDAAIAVGKLFADRCKKLGLKNMMFDRSGYKYHGRVKALADAVRENGFKEF